MTKAHIINKTPRLVIEMLEPKTHKARKNLGFTMIEMMLVLVIAAIIIMSVTRYYTTVRENARIAQAVSMINDVVSASFKWVEGRTSSFTGLTLQTLVNAQLLPYAIYGSTNPDIANPWKGKINVVVGVNTNNMQVTLSHVPPTSCGTLEQKIKNVGGILPTTSTCSTGTFTITFTEN